MSKSYKVSIKGVSHKNTDGSSRQGYIKTLQIGDKVNLLAEPMHIFDRWAVAVLTTSGKQIGYLPSDARDSSTLLKGEPIVATVKYLTGGVNWFSRFFLRKKYIGVVLLLKKENVDWQRYDKLSSIVKPIDEAIKKALEIEKVGMIQEVIDIYKTVINEIKTLNKNDRYASAHRNYVAPIDRLSLLLEKEKEYEEAKQVIEHFRNEYDPIRPNKAEQDRINKRYDRILKKLEKK
jgi:hypothetical protein